MHVADLTKGILGANGIVGGGLAISVGAAFGEQLSGAGRVAGLLFRRRGLQPGRIHGVFEC